MKTETPTTPTIAELWASLSRQLCDLEDRRRSLENAEYFAKIGNFDTRDEFLENCQIVDRLPAEISKIQVFVHSLRQHLLDRCGEVSDSGGQLSIFSIDGNTLMIANTVDRLRHDNDETLSNFVNACNFWLWELEQRQKEMGALNKNP